MATLAFNTIFNAYFGLGYTSLNADYGWDLEDESNEEYLGLEYINEGDELKHVSGCRFKILALDEATDGINTLSANIEIFQSDKLLTVTDDFLLECFKPY